MHTTLKLVAGRDNPNTKQSKFNDPLRGTPTGGPVGCAGLSPREGDRQIPVLSSDDIKRERRIQWYIDHLEAAYNEDPVLAESLWACLRHEHQQRTPNAVAALEAKVV